MPAVAFSLVPSQNSLMCICSVEPSSTSGCATCAASSCARTAKRTDVAAWLGSGNSRLATM